MYVRNRGNKEREQIYELKNSKLKLQNVVRKRLLNEGDLKD